MTHMLRNAKRSTSATPELLRCGDYFLDARTLNCLAVGNHSVHCSPLEFKILRELMNERGRPMTLDRLHLRIFGSDEDAPSTDTIRVTIYRLRCKIKMAGILDPICSKPNVGYWICPGTGETELFVFDRARRNALEAVLQYARPAMPEEVALLRTVA